MCPHLLRVLHYTHSSAYCGTSYLTSSDLDAMFVGRHEWNAEVGAATKFLKLLPLLALLFQNRETATRYSATATFYYCKTSL